MSFILFGSQTGQAKSIAENLYETLSLRNNNFKLYELDEMDSSYFLEKTNIAIIICSTTGDGDAPENASKFLRKIKSYAANSLFSFRYTVLGLGDTNYSNFCNCGKTIDVILSKLGGKRFYNSNWADDAVGLELVIEPWLEGLYKAIREDFGDELVTAMERITVSDINTDSLKETSLCNMELLGEIQAANIGYIGLSVPLQQEPFLQINYNTGNVCDTVQSVVSTASLPSDKLGLQHARLTEIKRITGKYAIKTVHQVKLTIDVHDWTWLPGDSIGVLPHNPQWEVDSILSRLGLSLSDRQCPLSLALIQDLKKKNPKIPEHLIVPPSIQISLQSVLTWLCDIRAPLSKAGLRIMAEFCPTGSAEQLRLFQLCSREGQMLYLRCIREPCMPILDLLKWFPSCKIPIERLLEVLPRLKPRAYSLCDCDNLSFAFSKVDIAPVQAFRKRPLTGICTTWMESLMTREDEVTIPIYLRKNLNGFTVSNPEDPHILIGPGTGVSPFIGFLQYFDRLKKRGEKVGPIWLFFGCRNEERDFIFRDQLEYYLQENVLSHLCVCFSRDTPSADGHGETRVACRPPDCKYVQDCLLYHSRQLTSLVIDGGARIFVCGDASGMAKDVLSAWSAVLLSGGHDSVTSKKDADGFIARMRINKLYLEDIWL